MSCGNVLTYMNLYKGKLIINMAFIVVDFISSVKYMCDMVFSFSRLYRSGYHLAPASGWCLSFSLSIYKHFPEYKCKGMLVKVEEREPLVIWWLKCLFSNVIFEKWLINKCYALAFCILSVCDYFSENFKAKEILMQLNISFIYTSFIKPTINIFFMLGIINEKYSLYRLFSLSI